ncbi:MAG: efflux RND transporter periplasmic adaptor subunit, partial [Moraxella sp.]|nr:efflux RND transporter periplasmic adaptor subunit [Moraxella sp.]
EAGIKSAEAGVKSAESGVKTAQANVESARANVSQAQASINSAKAVHDASRLDMSRTIVRAPISGRIGISAVTAGTLVSASQATALATISRTDLVYVDIQQSSSEMLKLRQLIASGKAGQGTPEVQIVLESGETYPLIGQLALEDTKVDEATGSVTIRAVFPNPDGVLIPGMYVNANLAQAVVANATLLPQTAITRTPKGAVQVYVVNADKKIEVREVKTAGTFNGQWVVTEGLNNGDQVVVMGGAKVQPDQAVEVKVAMPALGQGGRPQDEHLDERPKEQVPQDDQAQTIAPMEQDEPQGQNSVMAPSVTPRQQPSDLQNEAEAMADETQGN